MAAASSFRPSKAFWKWLTVAGLGIPLAAFLVAWSGLYNVAASSGHWAVVDWFLRFGMSQSVSLRARATPPPPNLDNSDLVRLGAAHFQIACTFCHGSPMGPVNPVTDQMLPPPPNLSTSMRPWKDEELFWIVQHGIKYTGMPGWVAIERHDEVWAAVAFLKRLQFLDREAYRDLAFGRTQPPPEPGDAASRETSGGPNVALCARCHGDARGGPTSALIPSLHGQSEPFLSTALRNYATGVRRSGIMQPIAADLDDRDIDRIAAYYARLPEMHRPSNAPASARGRQLATEGDPAIGVPACNACHSRDALAVYPRLGGQNAAYMAGQLRVWKRGHNAVSHGTAIMAPIARRLDDQDIDAVTAYFASMSADTSAARPP